MRSAALVSSCLVGVATAPAGPPPARPPLPYVPAEAFHILPDTTPSTRPVDGP